MSIKLSHQIGCALSAPGRRDCSCGVSQQQDQINAVEEALVLETQRRVEAEQALSVERARKVEQGLRLGQILGREYDGVSLDEVARRLVAADHARAEAEQELSRCKGRYDKRVMAHSETHKKLAEAEQQLQRWKEAVIDAAVVNWTYRKAHENDPRAAINALLCQAQLEALDPTISEYAEKLHARIHELEQQLAEVKR